MEDTLIRGINDQYNEVLRKIESMLCILDRCNRHPRLRFDESLILQMTPKSEDLITDKNKSIFDFVIHIGLTSSKSNASDRIIKKDETSGKVIPYVSVSSKMRNKDLGNHKSLCPVRDMWFLISKYPEIKLWDYATYHRNDTLYIRTDVKPIIL